MKTHRFTLIKATLGISLLLAGCAPANPSEQAATGSATSPAVVVSTETPEPTAVPTPTFTPTPVSFAEAAARGTLAELETYGKGRLQAGSFSPDGSFFAAATLRGLYVFKPHTWEEITFLPAEPGVNIRFLRFSSDSSLLAGGDSAGNVTFWNTKNWEVGRVIAAGKGPITSLDIAPGNKTCITINDAKAVALWDMESGEQIKSMTRTKDTGSVSFSRDGSWFMLSEPGGLGDLTTWKAGDFTFIGRYHQLGRAPDQAISPFGDAVASYSFRTLTIHDFDQNKDYEFKDIFGFFDDVQMVFVNDVTLLIKSNYADSYRLYDLRTGSMIEESMTELPKLKSKNPDLLYLSKAEEIQALGFEPFSKIVAVSPRGDRLILDDGIFNLSAKSFSKPNLVNDSSLWRNTFVLDDGYVVVVDPSQPKFPNKEKKGNLILSTLDFSDMTSVDKKYIPYDLPDGISTTALSPDGSTLATGLYDGSAYFWNVKTGEQIAEIRAHAKVYEVFGLYGAFKEIAFHRDGTHVLTLGVDKTIKVWSLGDKDPILTLNGMLAAFTPDGQGLVFIDGYNRIQFASLFDKEPQVTLEGENKEINALTFSKDGSLLITGGREAIKIWSMAEKSLVTEIPLNGSVRSLAISPDGARLFVSTFDGVLSAWGSAP